MKTNMPTPINFSNYGFVQGKLNDELYDSLMNEINTAKDNNIVMKSGLTGTGVSKHYYLKSKENIENLKKEIHILHEEYEKTFDVNVNVGPLSKSVPYYFDVPWVNFQKKGEFIPMHIHDGLYSFAIFMNIPYDSEVEQKDGSKYASSFQFRYINALGDQCQHVINLSPKDNGSILFFSARLSHIVYPFYSSDDERISISGNIKYYTGEKDD